MPRGLTAMKRERKRSPDEAQRNPGQDVDETTPDFASLRPGYGAWQISPAISFRVTARAS